jgi:hypothetical protein
MTFQSNQHVCAVLLAIAYALMALPFPVVLLDHDLGMAKGGSLHSNLDEHAWLEDVSGTSAPESSPAFVVADPEASPAIGLLIALSPQPSSLAVQSRAPPSALTSPADHQQ